MIVKMGFVRRARAETFGSGRGMVNKLAFYNRILFLQRIIRELLSHVQILHLRYIFINWSLSYILLLSKEKFQIFLV